MTKNQLETFKQKITHFANAMGMEKPKEPALRFRYHYPVVAPYMGYGHENIGLDVNPVIFEATMQAIIQSDHPMLVEAVRKLYALGKLCLPADEPLVDEAIKNVRNVDDENIQVDRHNTNVTEEYEARLNHWNTNAMAAQENLIGWWNDYLETIQEKFLLTKKLSENPLGIQYVITALNERRNERIPFEEFLEGRKITEDWMNKREPNMLVNLFGGPAPKDRLDSTYTNFIRKIFEDVRRAHGNFLAGQREELEKKIKSSRAYKRDLVEIENYFGWYRRKLDDQSYNHNYYDYYEFSKNGEYTRVSWQDRMNSELEKLEKAVQHQIDLEFKKRRSDGVDGYEEFGSV